MEYILSNVLSLIQKVDRDVAIVLFAVFFSAVLTSIFFYVVRLRDHIFEESQIRNLHFGKVKDYIRDLCDSLEDTFAAGGVSILERDGLKMKKEPVEPDNCSESCDRLQNERFAHTVERFEHDIARAVEKLYSKSCGWIRENGFHSYQYTKPEGRELLASYSKTRGKQAIKFLVPYMNARAKYRAPVLSGKADKYISESALVSYVSDIAIFAIDEFKIAERKVNEYRRNHGLLLYLLFDGLHSLLKKKEKK